ncbi:MAG: c-type cytochrome [Alphaproteobacteria bacterium]|nr:c-type cytochrome [Alphaproteobacteria bacterium]
MQNATHIARLVLLVMVGLAVAGFRDDQSVLAPNAAEAGRIAHMSWLLFIGGAVILVAVMTLVAIALVAPAGWRRWLRAEKTVIAGGVIFPTLTLTVLLVYGLTLTRAGEIGYSGVAPLEIAVSGERWWWRVTYTNADGQRFESANEVRLPVNREVRLVLSSPDVIHSFWVPRLAGKIDMIPGHTTFLRLKAARAGVSRGQCAEYCGGPHALMSFKVVSLEPAAYEQWLQEASGPAREPQSERERRGKQLFLSSGCGACHSVRGTDARGRVGPDLTHVGGRLTLAAAVLDNNAEAFGRWIAHNQEIKPGNLMPPFKDFSDEELRALSVYLASLR